VSWNLSFYAIHVASVCLSVCPLGETKHRHSARHKQSIILMQHDAFTGMEKCTPVVPTSFSDLSKLPLNLQEPCVLYIGRANRYPPNTPIYIFFQQISVQNFLNMLHNLRFFFLFKMPLTSQCYLFWFLYYSHFTYRVC
jgi:hypothetical protein